MKIDRSEWSTHQIEATFKDCNGNKVTESIPSFSDGNPIDLLLNWEKQLLKLQGDWSKDTDGLSSFSFLGVGNFEIQNFWKQSRKKKLVRSLLVCRRQN